MNIKDVYVNFIQYGNKSGKNIVLLHGWGQNIEMMDPIGNKLKKNNRVIIVDLPGFGLSEEPKSVWTLSDYVSCIKTLLDSLNVKNPILIGHSFGGKISILYASKYKVDKLILLPIGNNVGKEFIGTVLTESSSNKMKASEWL